MRKIILAAIAATTLASALSVQAADRPARFDAASVISENQRFSGQ